MVTGRSRKSIPVYLDRYPAKMVTTLSDKIVQSYVGSNSCVLDPFCGSGAILNSAQKHGSDIIGIDVNPYAILLSRVKLEGFDYGKAQILLDKIINRSKRDSSCLVPNYKNIGYWFTPMTLNKLCRLRYHLQECTCNQSKEGRAILLAFALSIRLVSKADQRSPKPFISKKSLEERAGKHFDPYIYIQKLLYELGTLYPPNTTSAKLICNSSVTFAWERINGPQISHIITSPPYINAQDYFRNSKFELYFLEKLLSFEINQIKCSFVGGEYGPLELDEGFQIPLLEQTLEKIKDKNRRLSIIVRNYFRDMNSVLNNSFKVLDHGGRLILICGDNMVCGQTICTWSIINDFASSLGFSIIDQFKDRIQNRSLPPKRMGHKGIIKDEIVTVFKK